ncbi:MAG: ABC transporter permease [Pseudobutyrivibrio sp.]|uniref:ABC transporter permease n=1 Tax=Pseudobutyrivibrio sp. TaxID=2014367 RepID=UPI0025FA7E1A|nr:ABC transporter permease [Pseudobutyrivibrio sp.]MBQ8489165.1 ABC transporter permease [Pseudobutyrivibrio sp.]
MSKSRLNFKANTLPAIVMVGPVVVIMVLLIAVPLIYVGIMSSCSIDEFYNVTYNFTLENYIRLANQDYLKIYSQSICIAFITTLICILIGYPFSYFIARTKSKKKKILYMLVIIPFWTNSLIRIYGWRTFLGTNGWLNIILQLLNITDEPIDFLYKTGATVLGMVYCLIPFMILPLYTSIEKLDVTLLEASSDLGAGSMKTFVNVILPLTSGGIFSGSLMVFIPCLGYFFVSDILGGGNSDVIGNLIERQFQGGNNWPLGAALSIVLIVVTLALVKVYQKLGGDMDALGV